MPSMPVTFRSRRAPSPQVLERVADERRGSARERGYDASWDRASIRFRQEHPLCLGCAAVGRVVAASVTDHVEPHKGDRVRFWDRAGWQPSCEWHHSVVKQKLEARWAKGEIGADALRLDSPAAKALTLALDPR